MCRREVATWHHMTLLYELLDAWKLDSFRKMITKAFMFDNGRACPGSAVSCIYKFIVSQELDARRGTIETTMLVRKFSNHSPLILTIWGQLASLDNINHYFDLSFLGEEDNREEMLRAWEGDLPRPIDVPD